MNAASHNPKPLSGPDRHEAVVQAAARAIAAHYGGRLVSLAVFGSVARGTARSDSDVDLLVVAEDLPRGRVGRAAEFRVIEQQTQDVVADAPLLSPVFKTREELTLGSPLLLDMVEDVRILVDREGFLAGRLDRLAGRLRELGSRRVWRDGWWYWDLKPDYSPGEVFEL